MGPGASITIIVITETRSLQYDIRNHYSLIDCDYRVYFDIEYIFVFPIC